MNTAMEKHVPHSLERNENDYKERLLRGNAACVFVAM